MSIHRFKKPFTNQPWHFLVIDINGFTDNGLNELAKILCGFFEMISKLVNINERVPYVGVSLIDRDFEVIAPLNTVEEVSLALFQNLLHRLRTRNKWPALDYERILTVMFENIAVQVDAKSVLKIPQIEIEILASGKHVHEAAQLVQAISAEFDINKKIKKIEFVNFFEFSAKYYDEVTFPLQVTNMNFGKWYIYDFLKCWLDDQTTDIEALSIKFGGVELKCDIYERILRNEDFKDYPEAISANGLVVDIGKPVTNVPLFELNGVKAVKMSGICDSLIYGTPLLVQATMCWKSPWEQLEENFDNFRRLASYLSRNQLCLLCKLGKSNLRYILMASNADNIDILLLKMIANGDQMMNQSKYAINSLPSSSVKSFDKIDSILSKLSIEEIYNPLNDV